MSGRTGPLIAICVAGASWSAATADLDLFPRAPYGLVARPKLGPYLDRRLPPRAPSAHAWKVVPAFPQLTFRDPVGLVHAPRSDRLYVHCRQGEVWVFDNDPQVRTKTMFLDLTARCQGWDDCGLLGMAFHPDFGEPGSPNRGYVYVWYNCTEAPTRGPGRPHHPLPRPMTNRLSRFTVPDGALAADPRSELVLIDQHDEHVWHNGGGMFFHPRDGFLYLGLGDEGGASDQYGNSQRIDRDLFAGVIRIDVDRDPRRSFAIRKQPVTGRTAHYYIPRDNPWVGVPGALEEFWCIGLRNPHRMTVDPVTGWVLAGEIGQAQREMVHRIEKGANYGWAFREGSLPHGRRPRRVLGVEKRPLWEYDRTQGVSVIGGYVYRGKAHPELAGQYIFADWNGPVWAMDWDGTGTPRVSALSSAPSAPAFHYGCGISSFGVDRAGELYLCQMGLLGRIWKLARATAREIRVPLRLSETGVFADLATLRPRPGLVPYDVVTPLWSDGAEKLRWIAVPDGKQIEFRERGEWTFPAGTVFVKHFQLADDRTRPASRRRLETRLLVRAETGGVYGLTYRWRPDRSDADLLFDWRTENIPLREEGWVGEATRTQEWYYPSRRDCLTCHTPQAGDVLGVKTRQLNRPLRYPGGYTDNQLRTWAWLGLADGPAEVEIPALPRLAALDDPQASLEAKARSYLDANCAGCHRPSGANATFDARWDTPLASQRLLRGHPQAAHHPGERIVLPGDPGRSLLFKRMLMLSPDKMPPLARNLPDREALAVMGAWIRGLSAVTSARPVQGTGTGLVAEYFAGMGFQEHRLTRTDAQVAFDWGLGSPDRRVPPDRFSARGTGQLAARHTETHDLTVLADDGVRLWLDGQLVLDQWRDQVPTEFTVQVPLVAGKRVDLKLEFYENQGGAMVRLAWSSPSQDRETIPRSQLYPPPAGPPGK